MSDDIQQKRFKSILDYNPPFQSILKVIGPEIEFSITSLLNNSSVKTYFNMIALEYYNFEYNQLLSLNDLKLVEEKTGVLNLTVLELIYNIVYQIVLRKWRYSNYVAYDIYILPIRIEKYIRALNYELKKYQISKNKSVFRLVPGPSKHVSIILNKHTYAESVSCAFENFRTVDKKDMKTKMLYFNEIINFLEFAWPLVEKAFGPSFAVKIKNEIELIKKINVDKLKESELRYVHKTTDKIVNISMMIFLLMSDNMDSGLWDSIVEKQKVELKRKEAEMLLNKINGEIRELEERELAKEAALTKRDENGNMILRKIKQPNINLNNLNPNEYN